MESEVINDEPTALPVWFSKKTSISIWDDEIILKLIRIS
jgi:hypothetical protein